MTRTTCGREPFEAVYLFQDLCSRTYGTAPCDAVLAVGGRKCFNTVSTCQSQDNFLAGTPLQLRFCKNQAAIPDDGNYWLPFLESARVTSGEINAGGGNKSVQALGKRATATFTFTDRPHNDRVVDPYQAERISGVAQADGVGYDPLARATFWTKWKARNRYYLNRPIIYVSGYIEAGQIVDAETRTFFVTGFSGPTAGGSVTIEARDILSFISNDKAKAPALSEGKLSADISAAGTSFTVTPSGIGANYGASGSVRIGDEMITFTRSGDTFTVVSRDAAEVGAASDHKAGDRVQEALVYSAARPDDIVYDLMVNYAGIDPAYLDAAGWETEVDSFMPRLYNATITEPTGVQQLLSELCEQMYFYIWWDERNDLVRLRAVRPAEGESVYNLNSSQHLWEDSVDVQDQTDQLITRVIVNYGLIDPAKGLEEPSNYAATELVGAPLEEGADRQRAAFSKVIYSRWLDRGDGAAALDLGTKLLARYSFVPKAVSFAMDAKDRDIWVGDFVSVENRANVDDVGIVRPMNIQVLSAREEIAGHKFTYRGQEFLFETAPNADDRPLSPGGDLFNLNIRDYHDEKYGALTGTETITLIIRNGVSIRSVSTALYALQTGSWPPGVTLKLVIEPGGAVLGKGGDAGRGGGQPAHGENLNGEDGGPCLLVDYPISIDNGGKMYAGGGGGGGGEALHWEHPTFGTTAVVGGGGGGGGSDSGAGAQGGNASGGSGTGNVPGGNGNAGGETTRGGAGAGGVFSAFVSGQLYLRGGNGGPGGWMDSPNPALWRGQNGSAAQYYGAGNFTRGEGPGLGGNYGTLVNGIADVTWINKGNAKGLEV